MKCTTLKKKRAALTTYTKSMQVLLHIICQDTTRWCCSGKDLLLLPLFAKLETGCSRETVSQQTDYLISNKPHEHHTLICTLSNYHEGFLFLFYQPCLFLYIFSLPELCYSSYKDLCLKFLHVLNLFIQKMLNLFILNVFILISNIHKCFCYKLATNSRQHPLLGHVGGAMDSSSE